MEVRSDALAEWRAGWPAVGAGTIGAAAVQIHFSTIGVLIKPIEQSTGWASSTITMGLLMGAVASIPGSPAVGWLAERYGLDRLIMIGLPLYFLAFGSLGVLSHSYDGWVLGWATLAVVSLPCKANLWMLWIAQRFDAARGMAFAVITSGSGVLAIVAPILTQLCVETVGWRQVFPLLSAGMALLAIGPCWLAFRRCPAAPGLKDGRRPPRDEVPRGLTVGEAVRMSTFWKIALIAFLIGMSIMSLQVHLAPMFLERRLEPRAAALVAGCFGGAALVARFVTGGLLDRLSANRIGMLTLLLPASACLIYLFVPASTWVGVAVALLFGIGAGAEGDVVGYVTSRHFGVRSFGTIFGMVLAAFALGAGLGPFLMSVLRDHFGSYQLVIPIVFAELLACALLFATLSRRPAFGHAGGAADAVGGDRVGPTGASGLAA